VEKDGSAVVRDRIALTLVKKYLQPKASILEIGSGNGLFIESLASLGFSLTATDLKNFLSPAAREVAKQFQKIDIDTPWPFHDVSFDSVTAWNVIEHAENPSHVARESARVLKSGGLLFLSLPNIYNLKNRLYFLRTGDMYRYKGRNSHITIITKMVFGRIFKNFDIVETSFYANEPPLLGKIFPKSELFSKTVLYVLRKR